MKFVQRKSGVGSVHLNTEPTNEYKSVTNEISFKFCIFIVEKDEGRENYTHSQFPPEGCISVKARANL